MEWYIYRENGNTQQIEQYNIFQHSGFSKDVKKVLKESITKAEFTEKLKRELQYYFWSRCEWEVLVAGWPPTKDRAEEIKIDVYDQVMLNWNVFCDYLWRSKKEEK